MDTFDFFASVAPTQSAFQVHGAGDGARLVLDIPEYHIARVLPVLSHRDKVFKVTITVMENQTYGERNSGG